MEPWSFKWFKDHVGLPSKGLTPSKTLQNCHATNMECEILCGKWEWARGHNGYFFTTLVF